MKATRGFTLVEVMVAVGLIAVGAMGVLGLLRQSARANRHARQLDVATQIAENWLERLKIDALEWALPANGNPLQAQTSDHTARSAAVEEQLLINTQWLRVVSDHAGSVGPFRTIPLDADPTSGSGPDISSAFDQSGQDVQLGGDDPHAYCTSFRLSWVRWPRTLRADVRVWWPRPGSGVALDQLPFSVCQDNDLTTDQLADYHTVYLSSLISATRIQH